MDLITIYHSALYYICMILITRYIFDCTPRTWILFGSFLVFMPLTFISVLDDNTIFSILYVSTQILQFILIKMVFPKVSIRQLLVSYIILYCLNMLLISIAVSIAPAYYLVFDYLINALTFILCVSLCFSKIHHTVRKIIEWTPKYILMICGLLLVSATAISVFTSGTELYPDYDILIRVTRIVVSILLLAICIVLPVIILISVSNSKLKSLTGNYEQQIRNQAKHYQNLAEANHEVRRFKHDFKNISIGIEKMLADGNYEQAIDYLRSYNRDLNTPGVFCSAFDTGNGIADALLTDKQEKASAYNTIIVFHGALPLDLLSPTDLCVVLGNSLDNAIEACQKLSPEKVKTISLDCTCNSGFLFLTISNPVDHKVVIRDNYVATTKDNKTLHGFGLYSLHSVVRKYNGDVRLTSTDTSFTVSIDLCMVSSQQPENSLPH